MVGRSLTKKMNKQERIREEMGEKYDGEPEPNKEGTQKPNNYGHININLRLNAKVAEELKTYCDERGLKRYWVIQKAIKKYIENESK